MSITTYSGILAWFLCLPIVLLGVLTIRDQRQRLTLPTALRGWSFAGALGVLVLVAVLYTTPWDNHLVATRVWWYDSQRVLGITLGWIPLEELLFFVLQTLLVGLWLLWIARRLPAAEATAAQVHGALRWVMLLAGGALWLAALVILRVGWRPGTYLGWELVWALPPILLQLGLGADILWQQRRLLGLVLIPAILYLSLVDALAIHLGIWTINLQQSLGVLIGGVLPIEECIFFLLTTTLVTLGLILGLATASRQRIGGYLQRLAAFTAYAHQRERKHGAQHTLMSQRERHNQSLDKVSKV